MASPGGLSGDFDALGERARASAEALGLLTARLRELRGGRGGGGGGGATGTVGVAAGGGEGGGGGVFAALSGLKAGAFAAVGALAAIPGQVQGFVEAFNPFVIEQFNTAMGNISATIGRAFEPIFQVMLDLARQANAIIAPLFQALRPVIETMAREFGERMLPVIKLIAEAGAALVPLFQLLAEAGRPMAAFIPALANILRLVVAVGSGLAAMFGNVLDPFRAATDQIVAALKQAVRGLIVFAAQLAAFLKLNKVVESIQKAFGPVKPGGETRAPRDVAITDMGAILRDATLAAFTAQGTAAKSTEDWLGDISGQLKEALGNQADFEARLQAMLFGIAAAAFPGLAGNVKDIAEFVRMVRERGGKLLPRDQHEAAVAKLSPTALLILRAIRGGGD